MRVVTGEAFDNNDFLKALTEGFCLTAKVAYLAHIRGGIWHKTCLAAQYCTEDAAKLCSELPWCDYEFFYTMCLKGASLNSNRKISPNYLMAYYINPDETLEYMRELSLWNEILQISNQSDREDVKQKVRKYLAQYASHMHS